FIYDTLVDIFPQLNIIDDYLEVTLNNIGMLLHPALSLMNAGAIDGRRAFKFYKEGATPRACEVLETIQFELNKIFQKLGLKQIKFCKWANSSYGTKEKNIYETIQNIDAYRNISAPKTLMMRYLTEDVPTGLVPTASLGEFLQIDTPVLNSIIKLSSILSGIDFKKEGRTIENLGLEDYLTNRIKLEEPIEISELESKKVKI
ncbi:MAG: NAD/NADP octopine/nopaline dehydrogenase family protein, partial [Candidatus Hodarchaeota archaeon]